MAAFNMTLTAVSANVVYLNEGRLSYTSYGSGYAWDDTLSAKNIGMRLNTTYTLGNTRASGTAYVCDANGKTYDSVKVIYVDHPGTAA